MREIFNSFTLDELRKLGSKYNKSVKIAGISKMKKVELINELMKYQTYFKDLKKKEVKPKKKEEVKPKKKEEVKPKKKEEVKPKEKEEPKEEQKKEKPKFMILKEEIDDLLKQLKKKYEKNKPKLDKMTRVKYRNAIKRQNSKFLDDSKYIYHSLEYNFDINAVEQIDKRFYEMIPKEKPKI